MCSKGSPRWESSFDYKNLTITVTEMDELRVTRLLVERHEPQEEED